jgi:hypothetical protein
MVGVLNQGEMGILIAAYLFSRGIVNPSQFNLTIIAVVILTMISPAVMKMAAVRLHLQSSSVQESKLRNRKPSSAPL